MNVRYIAGMVNPSLAAGALGWRLEVDLTSGLKEAPRFFGAD